MYRLLVVEDNPGFRRILQMEFTFLGFEVLQAADGATGLEMARSEKPDVILMDVDFGGARPTGLEATEELKRDEQTRGIPIIVLTGRVMPEEQERARRAGGDVLIEKSVESFDELINSVQSLLTKRPPT